jgi:hypothetical protein
MKIRAGLAGVFGTWGNLTGCQASHLMFSTSERLCLPICEKYGKIGLRDNRFHEMRGKVSL